MPIVVFMRRIPGWPRSGSADPPPPPAGRRDIAIAATLALIAIADIPEGVATWQPASAIAALVAVGATYWRRSQPLTALAAGFTAQFATDVGSGIVDTEAESTFGHVLALGVLVYAISRWGTWRAITIGLTVAVGLSVAGETVTAVPVWDQQFTNALIWGMFAAAGIAVRYRDASQRTRADQIRSEERERIARDLHDVVAHHVSAIAIQAEGARAGAHSNPDKAIGALETIHATASTALAEMRHMVGILRDSTEPGRLTPEANVHELPHLLTNQTQGPPVGVTLGPGLESLSSAVTSAVLRIAQEAVTNARRHSRNARSVEVNVQRQEHHVEITVVDDGDRVSPGPRHGYGIIGMTERCAMLGGTLTAEPLHDRGWRVQATIPIESTTR